MHIEIFAYLVGVDVAKKKYKVAKTTFLDQPEETETTSWPRETGLNPYVALRMMQENREQYTFYEEQIQSARMRNFFNDRQQKIISKYLP
jgi:hypothetical protein